MPGDGPDQEWGVTPNPGLEAPLDEEEYLDWRRFRARRDMLGVGGDPQLQREIDLQEGSLPADFDDRALSLAVEALRNAAPSIPDSP